MKKIYFLAAVAIAAAGFTACGDSAPKEDLKSDVDSLSYTFGIDQGRNIEQYPQQMQIDTAYIDKFIEGMNDGAQNIDDKRRAAYNAGIGVDMQMNMVIRNQIDRQIFGRDSTESVSSANFLANFTISTRGHGQKTTVEQTREVEQKTSKAIQMKTAGETYGASRKKNDACIAANAKEEGVKTIGQGVQVKRLKAGSGATPKASDVVKINYVGKTIDGRVLDQRDSTTISVGGVIPGFTEASAKMPAGAEWEITIPYTAGYGARQPSPDLKPFSTLIFTVELFSIEKASEGQPGMPQGISAMPQGEPGI